MAQTWPVISRDDYQRFREVIGNDLDWPETFHDFEQSQGEKIAKLAAKGIAIERPVVDFDEFVVYCRDSGVAQNGVSFAAYAASKDWGDPDAKGKRDEGRSRARNFLDKGR